MARKLPTTWKTRDGRVLRICEMSDDHIASTITMLKKRGYITMAEKKSRCPGPPPRMNGEYAQMAAEQAWSAEWDRWFALKHHPALDALYAEQEWRKKQGIKIEEPK